MPLKHTSTLTLSLLVKDSGLEEFVKCHIIQCLVRFSESSYALINFDLKGCIWGFVIVSLIV